ncbi:MAG: virulence RhuM family protein [Desulfotalea sp.]
MTEKTTDIIIYKSYDGNSDISVRIENEDAWLSQRQIVELFQAAKSTVSEHIKNIYDDEELLQEATVRKIRTVQKEGDREVTRNLDYYNLDMIIALGYRINSKIATRFRQWATQRLKEYMIKGFTMDDERLKHVGGGHYWKELLNRIRDIRSSEKVMYRQVLELYATATDYKPKSEESLTFFKRNYNGVPVQNTLGLLAFL